VRWLLLAALAAAVGLGLHSILRSGQPLAAVPWLLVLLWHPLVALMIDFGREEVIVACLLLAIWLALRESPGAATSRGRAVAIGVLTAAVSMLRPELSWVPWLWWVALPWVSPEPPRSRHAWPSLPPAPVRARHLGAPARTWLRATAGSRAIRSSCCRHAEL
jgi:hypothetical protein